MMRAGHASRGGTAGRRSDGRNSNMADWASLRYAVVDVEGNGQQPPDLVELATVPVVGGVIGEPVSWLVKPDTRIKHMATRIHGLSNEDVAGAPAFAEIEDEIIGALAGAALVAHNAHGDGAGICRNLPGWARPYVFDTLQRARWR